MQHVTLIRRRKEWMAAEVLRTGKVTISGELYQTVVVDFGRDAALDETGNWADPATSLPLDDLQDWADLIAEKSGSEAHDVVMDIATWKKFRNNDQVKQRLKDQRPLTISPTIAQEAAFQTGGNFMGAVDDRFGQSG